MLGKKGMLLVAVLFIVMVLLTGRARLTLDHVTASFRNDFREMLYLPRGKSLKLIACGFDAPLADALFIKAMIYFGESMADDGKVATGRAYTFELFDVITDLSPRFTRAYQMGSVLLTSSSDFDTKLKGIRLLDKGVATFDRLAAEKEEFVEDPRWLLHSLLATTYDVDVQGRKRRDGDMDAAAVARENAAREFRLAAQSKDAPEYIIAAAAGYERYQRGMGEVESSALATLSIWGDLYEQAKARGDTDVLPDIEERIQHTEDFLWKIAETRELQKFMSDAGKRYLQKHGHAPRGVADLVADGLFPQVQAFPMDSEDHKDVFIVLPDGSFKSMSLAVMETNNQFDMLNDALFRFRRVHRQYPTELQELVDNDFLDQLPIPPLEKLGQHYDYEKGMIEEIMPYGPELPPNLQ